jgi:hypothetical protein
MNISEILITVGLTVAGSVVIAYTTLCLQAKRRRKALFQALQNEVELNLLLAQQIKSGDIIALGGCPELHTDAYNNMRLAGEVLSLKENIRHELQYTYEMINMLNRSISLDGGLRGAGSKRLGGIIQRLELLENELAKKMQKPTKRSDYAQQDLLQRLIMSQVPLFYFFGLLSIYTYYLSKLDTGVNMSIWDWVQYTVSQLLMPIGIAFIVWAFILSIVSLNCKMPRILEGVRRKIRELFMEEKIEPIVYAATMVVFGAGFADNLADLVRTGIGFIPLLIVYGIGLALIIVLVVDNILRARQKRPSKAKTQNDSETQA